MTRRLKSIELVKGNVIETLPLSTVEPLGWEKDFELLANTKTAFNSYRRLQEYFINKHKFCS